MRLELPREKIAPWKILLLGRYVGISTKYVDKELSLTQRQKTTMSVPLLLVTTYGPSTKKASGDAKLKTIKI